MRILDQAIETLQITKPKNGDLIMPFNHKKFDKGISPTLTTRPEGLKTMILVVEVNNENSPE